MWNKNDKEDKIGLSAWGSLKGPAFNEFSLEMHMRQISEHGLDKRKEYCLLLI